MFDNCKQKMTSLSLLAGTTVHVITSNLAAINKDVIPINCSWCFCMCVSVDKNLSKKSEAR